MNNGDRVYLDYNATAPLAKSVLDWLKQGQFHQANPSSVHTSGKKARRDINRCKEFLFETFGLSSDTHNIFFHSGATEGINTLIKGTAGHVHSMRFIYCETDHSCIHHLRADLESFGHEVFAFKSRDYDHLEKLVSGAKDGQMVFVNWTWVNNETGLVAPLSHIVELKKKHDFYVHVDAVQAVGKIKNWAELDSSVDAYTFSAHKFGGLKGTGFSFYTDETTIKPLLNGGGQQDGVRSGTENSFGIASIPLALEEIKKNYDADLQHEAKALFENKLLELLKDKGEIVGLDDQERNGNTVYFVLYETKAQTSAMALDMAGFDVSNGSACSSGAVIPSRVLMSMGYDDEQARSAIRVSFSPFLRQSDVEAFWPKFEKVIKRFV